MPFDKNSNVVDFGCGWRGCRTKQHHIAIFKIWNRPLQDSIKEEAEHCGMPYVNARWLGGMLTNFSTIRTRIGRLNQLRNMKEDGTFDLLPKKEVVKLELEIEKLEKFIGGIQNMDKLPGALFIVDPHKERIAVAEAKKNILRINFYSCQMNTD